MLKTYSVSHIFYDDRSEDDLELSGQILHILLYPHSPKWRVALRGPNQTTRRLSRQEISASGS